MKKNYNCSIFNLKLFLLIFFVYANSYGLTIYVNDAATANDIFCSAIGSDANNGLTPATPKLSLAAALAIANDGDLILVDTGTYSGANNRSLLINKEIEIRGAGEVRTIFDNAIGVQRWASITASNVKVSLLTITRYALAEDGIAISITNGVNIILERLIIYANVGSAGQGAVFISGSSTNVTIRNSGSPCNRVSSANYGGGFKINGATVLFDNCSINNNVVSAILGGGILIVGNTSNVTINNSTFDDNEAAAGGAICIQNGTLNVNNSCFNGNTTNAGAGNNLGGGAILIQASTNGTTTNVNLNNCSFSNNSTGPASSDGGAITITNLNSPTCNVTIRTCSFTSNNAADRGEDIYFDRTNTPTFDVILENNTFNTIYSGTQVNLDNVDFPAAQIKFQQLAGFGANGDIVADGLGVPISNPEMRGNYTEISTLLPVGLPQTTCIDRFDGICGSSSATFTCLTENIWNGSNWSRGSLPTVFEHVILNASYNTSVHGNIDACQMTVNSGVTLDIMDGTDGTYVYVVNSIFNNGTINVNSKANLVQVNHPLDLNDEAIVTPNINFSKNTGDKIRWDYVYWGKPIADNILSAYNANFDIKYYWDPDFAGIGQSYLGWRVLNSEPSIGMGFITRVKTAIGMTPTNINLSYSGVSNNGDYNATVKYYDADNYSFRNFTLLGNPYPGAIDFEKFYLDNSDKIYGTVYLWSSYTPYPGSGLYQQADYASFNLTGGVGVPGTSNTQSPNGILPNGYIASAQGFMVRPKVNGQVVFNNSQRTKDIPSNNQFFRSQNQEKDRFWLRLKDSNGRFSDLLIGYIDKATNGFDEAYDGLLNSLSTLKFFSQLDEKRLVIQGKGTFNSKDTVRIGYAVNNQQSSMLTISLSKKEGIFNDQKIYLHDKKLNFYHDLTMADYFFYTDDTQNRFEVLYEIIKPEENLDNDDVSIFATIHNNELIVKSNSILSNVELYDINGRLIFKQDFNQDLMQFNKNVFLPNGIYIANVKTKSGFQKSIKISNQ
jgi:hypothetical protein